MKTTNRAFSIVETCVAVSLIALGVVMAVVEGRQMLANSKTDVASANCASLNFAMSEYRSYYSDGYRPDTVWAAEDAAGVIAELRKPLRRGSISVTALTDHDLDAVTALTLVRPRNAGNTADDFSPDCVWFPRGN